MSKLDTIKKKIKDAQDTATALAKSRRAYELGFTDLEDLDLWDALEALRQTELARRTEAKRLAEAKAPHDKANGMTFDPARSVVTNHTSAQRIFMA